MSLKSALVLSFALFALATWAHSEDKTSNLKQASKEIPTHNSEGQIHLFLMSVSLGVGPLD